MNYHSLYSFSWEMNNVWGKNQGQRDLRIIGKESPGLPNGTSEVIYWTLLVVFGRVTLTQY